jgi:hypothetical protein
MPVLALAGALSRGLGRLVLHPDQLRWERHRRARQAPQRLWAQRDVIAALALCLLAGAALAVWLD